MEIAKIILMYRKLKTKAEILNIYVLYNFYYIQLVSYFIIMALKIGQTFIKIQLNPFVGCHL